MKICLLKIKISLALGSQTKIFLYVMTFFWANKKRNWIKTFFRREFSSSFTTFSLQAEGFSPTLQNPNSRLDPWNPSQTTLHSRLDPWNPSQTTLQSRLDPWNQPPTIPHSRLQPWTIPSFKATALKPTQLHLPFKVRPLKTTHHQPPHSRLHPWNHPPNSRLQPWN